MSFIHHWASVISYSRAHTCIHAHHRSPLLAHRRCRVPLLRSAGIVVRPFAHSYLHLAPGMSVVCAVLQLFVILIANWLKLGEK